MSMLGFLAFLLPAAYKPAETKPIPTKFTPDLPGLIAWLETQDPATKYYYWDTADCLLCRFASTVRREPSDFKQAIDLVGGDNSEEFRRMATVSYGSYAEVGHGWNYGSALKMARSVKCA